jgi:hypothetical protein
MSRTGYSFLQCGVNEMLMISGYLDKSKEIFFFVLLAHRLILVLFNNGVSTV